MRRLRVWRPFSCVISITSAPEASVSPVGAVAVRKRVVQHLDDLGFGRQLVEVTRVGILFTLGLRTPQEVVGGHVRYLLAERAHIQLRSRAHPIVLFRHFLCCSNNVVSIPCRRRAATLTSDWIDPEPQIGQTRKRSIVEGAG